MSAASVASYHQEHDLVQALASPSPADTQDPEELREWCDALDGVLATWGPREGRGRAVVILDALLAHARQLKLSWRPEPVTPYLNTVRIDEQPRLPRRPGDRARLSAIFRWNALAMVVRPTRRMESWAGTLQAMPLRLICSKSVPPLLPRASEGHGGDLVYFQPHSAPGIYARAFLEGRLSEDALRRYRQELVAEAQGLQGLTFYPHPYLMPDFWQFPTGSMGIGPINAIYQAPFMRHLADRGLLATRGARCGASSATARWTSRSPLLP